MKTEEGSCKVLMWGINVSDRQDALPLCRSLSLVFLQRDCSRDRPRDQDFSSCPEHVPQIGLSRGRH